MPTPGDAAGECPRCGAQRVQIGYDHSVVGVYCPRCSLTVALDGDAYTVNEAKERDHDWDPDEWEPAGTKEGPDPWGD
ncbi:MAG: hypothetical protein ABEK12_01875 [Candidatus Nanohaloarchaea archaeon]